MTAATRQKTAAKVDPYVLITDRIVASLEAGAVPWHKPWSARDEQPRSLSSGKPYQGINVFMLLLTQWAEGYSSPWWGTYKQIGERGGQVRRGEKGTPVVFWRILEVKDAAAKDGVKKIPLLRHFTVFNACQCDDLTVPAGEPLVDHDPVVAAEAIVAGYKDGPKVGRGGNRACYHPDLDEVQVPLVGQFEKIEGYYSVLFHELGHSTGHKSRLNRDGITDPVKFGTEKYGKEELIAEMTAAFLCADAGVSLSVDQHAGYIGHWLGAIKGDPKLVVHAAGAAQKAANLILGRERPAEGDAPSVQS